MGLWDGFLKIIGIETDSARAIREDWANELALDEYEREIREAYQDYPNGLFAELRGDELLRRIVLGEEHIETEGIVNRWDEYGSVLTNAGSDRNEPENRSAFDFDRPFQSDGQAFVERDDEERER